MPKSGPLALGPGQRSERVNCTRTDRLGALSFRLGRSLTFLAKRPVPWPPRPTLSGALSPAVQKWHYVWMRTAMKGEKVSPDDGYASLLRKWLIAFICGALFLGSLFLALETIFGYGS